MSSRFGLRVSFFAAFASLVYHLLGHMSGNLLVVVELHRERATALGYRAQVANIALHFGEGSLRLYNREAGALRVHTEHAAPAPVEVRHDVARIAVGHSDVQVHDRFEEHR